MKFSSEFQFFFINSLSTAIETMAQASPYLGMPQLSSPYSHYTMSASPMLQVVSPAEAAVNSQLGVVAAAQAGGAGGYHGAPANKLQRSDRIEVRKLVPIYIVYP